MSKQRHDLGNRKARTRQNTTPSEPVDTGELAYSLVQKGLASTLILEPRAHRRAEA